MTLSELPIEVIFTLSPIGTFLFVGLAFVSLSSRYRSRSLHLLKRGAIVGALGAIGAAVVFALEADIRIPSYGTYFVILAVFLASFAIGVAVAFVIQLRS
jgi:hypothetical protein